MITNEKINPDWFKKEYGRELTFDNVFPEFGGAVFLCYIGKLPHKYFYYGGCYRGSRNDWENKDKMEVRIANTPIGSKTSIGFGHGHSTEFFKTDFCLSPSDKNYKGRDWKRRKLNGEPSRFIMFLKWVGKIFNYG